MISRLLIISIRYYSIRFDGANHLTPEFSLNRPTQNRRGLSNETELNVLIYQVYMRARLSTFTFFFFRSHLLQYVEHGNNDKDKAKIICIIMFTNFKYIIGRKSVCICLDHSYTSYRTNDWFELWWERAIETKKNTVQTHEL